MDKTNSNLYMYQKSLDKDSEVKASFIEAENEEDDDGSSDSDDHDTCKILIPKSKKKNDTSHDLLVQLIKQNQVLAKTQKKMYKLNSELEKEEVITRFIKLDLNNTQVKLEEFKELLVTANNQLTHVKMENLAFRSLAIMYFLFQVYCLFY